MTHTFACAQTHLAWIKTPRKKGGLGAMKIPIVADVTKARGLLSCTLIACRGSVG